MNITRFAIVPHPAEPKVLLVPEGEGWTLPLFRTDGPIEQLSLFNRSLREQWGVTTHVLRSTGEPVPMGEHDVIRFYWMERSGSDSVVEGVRWTGRDEAMEMEGLPAMQLVAIEEWFRESSPGESPPASRSPWAIAGWQDEAESWIKQQVDRVGLGPVSSIEQVRSWAITHMMRVVTPSGDLYFKAAHDMFPHEARLTDYLSQSYPASVPRVLAADFDRNWLLMEGFQGSPLGDVKEAEAWEQAIRLFARIQVESVGRAGELLEIGCPDRRLHRLAGSIDQLFVDEAAMTCDQESALTASQIEKLRGLRPELDAEIACLAGYPIPPSLLHGDLHPGNIVMTGQGPLLYDWSDGALAHPFFELLTTFEELHPVIEEEHAQSTHRSAYLEPWTRFAPIGQIEEAFDLSQKLLPLYHALSYYWIHQHTEPSAQWELSGGVGYFLKKLLVNFGAEERERELTT